MGPSPRRPALTPEEERSKAVVSDSDGLGMTFKLLINKNKIGGDVGACCSLWVTMGVARSTAVHLNNKEL